MFVTVILGEGRTEIFNLNCRIVTFIHCLKEKCNLDLQEHVDLVEQTGEIVNLMKQEHSTENISTLLKERQQYIVISVSYTEGSEEIQYSAVHDGKIKKFHPELEAILRQLLNPSKKQDKRVSSKKGAVNQIRKQTNSTKSITTAP